MDIFQKLERMSEKYLEGFFRKRFSGPLQPVEIAKELGREMRAKKTVSVRRVYVPNFYRVYVGEKDWEILSVFLRPLQEELEEYLRREAEEKKYDLVSGPRVEIVMDPAISPGCFRVEGLFAEIKDERKDTVGDIEKGREADFKEVTTRTVIAAVPGQQAQNLEEGSTVVAEGGKLLVKGELEVIRGEEKGKIFPLVAATQTIGRQEGCDIVLQDLSVSRRHACIEWRGDRFIIRDLGSTNGTYVNGSPVTEEELAPDDVICVGKTCFKFRVI